MTLVAFAAAADFAFLLLWGRLREVYGNRCGLLPGALGHLATEGVQERETVTTDDQVDCDYLDANIRENSGTWCANTEC